MRLNVRRIKNNHGVALIIVLLVTALLIALVFEFAYGTRVSFRAATNFRDSQRAYFLARSGINAFIKYPQLRDIRQGDWFSVPMISTGDTVVNIKWEDELGKICVSNLTSSVKAYSWLEQLFTKRVVNQDVLRLMADGNPQYKQLSELHSRMSDEDYIKVSPYLTVYSGDSSSVFCSGSQSTSQLININTASEAILDSVLATLPNPPTLTTIQSNKPYTTVGPDLSSAFTATSSIYRIYSYATVGGYTKQLEAVVYLNSSTPVYWKAL